MPKEMIMFKEFEVQHGDWISWQILTQVHAWQKLAEQATHPIMGHLGILSDELAAAPLQWLAYQELYNKMIGWMPRHSRVNMSGYEIDHLPSYVTQERNALRRYMDNIISEYNL